jgi:hypothetical protein
MIDTPRTTWPLPAACLALLVLGPAAQAAPPAGGYWLSAELEASSGKRVQAAAEMSGDAERVFPLDPAASLPGDSIARVTTIQAAMSWVSRWAFDGHVIGISDNPTALREAPAPSPGGKLLERHGAVLRSLVITGATPADGVREIAWPLTQESILPPDSEWSAAALVPTVAPLFAAPAPFVPPASERSGEAHRAGGLYLLGYLDRCAQDDGTKHCMRWAQVVARNGDRFTPGYLPAFQVAALDAWVRAPGNLPRGQLIPAAIDGEIALLLLLVRLSDNTLHAQMLELETHHAAFPEVTLAIEPGEATLTFAKRPPLRVDLSPDMDRRPSEARNPAPSAG